VSAIEFLLNVNRGFRVSLASASWSWAAATWHSTRHARRFGIGEGRGRPGNRFLLSAGAADDARRGLTTTLDAARAAVRAGVQDVTVIALESFEEMPAALEEIEEAEAEGVTIRYRCGPHSVVGEGRSADWRPSASCRSSMLRSVCSGVRSGPRKPCCRPTP
jgi:hypothetical protein